MNSRRNYVASISNRNLCPVSAPGKLSSNRRAYQVVPQLIGGSLQFAVGMSAPRTVNVGNKEIELPKHLTLARDYVRLFHHFNLFRLSSNVREDVPGDFPIAFTARINGSMTIFGLQGVTEENIVKLR